MIKFQITIFCLSIYLFFLLWQNHEIKRITRPIWMNFGMNTWWGRCLLHDSILNYHIFIKLTVMKEAISFRTLSCFDCISDGVKW